MLQLLFAALLPFFAAGILPLVTSPRGKAAGWTASAFVLASFGLVAAVTPVAVHHPITVTIPWIPSLGLNFSLYADGLSILFALLITGIGSVVFTFAAAYLGPHEQRRRFFCFLTLFMGSMLGVVLSANLISLFVFWELTSVTSFLLIGFWHQRDESRAGALKALVITGSGGLAMFVGFLVLGLIGGTFEVQALIAKADLIAAHPWAPAAAALVIVGIITKSAQFPFHLWLPSAMEAPTPVSAYLHAATMVKAGLYLAARVGPVLVGVQLWTPTLTVLGLVTMTWGSYLALRQRDLKGLLAFSTVSQLGLILSLLAAVEPAATTAGLLHLLNHGVFKGCLFLLVGIIEHSAHTRDLMRLGPLRIKMPVTQGILVLAALAMAGVPIFGGFVSKEMFLEYALGLPLPLSILALVGAGLTAAYCFALALGLGRGRVAVDSEEASSLHDPSWALLWGPALLALTALVLGPAAQPLAAPLIEAAASASLGGLAVHPHFALWHGLTPTLGASALVIGGGLLVYALWWRTTTPSPPTLVGDRVYGLFLDRLETWSRALTASYMSGLLWRYLTIILVIIVAGVGAAAFAAGVPPMGPWPDRPALGFEVMIAVISAGAAIGTAVAPTRLAAILALGASGYSLALIFALLGAPDLALTQIMVETIGVALFLAVFVYLPPYPGEERRNLRLGHLALSVAFGVGTVVLMAAARGARNSESISEFFLNNSVDAAGGHNVVNVILVDFRGLDTLGEITVLGVAALACYALIKFVPERAN